MSNFYSVGFFKVAPSSIDLSVQVLTTGFWPMPLTNVNVNLPVDVQKAFNEFRKYVMLSFGLVVGSSSQVVQSTKLVSAMHGRNIISSTSMREST